MKHLITILISLCCFSSKASHIVGGDIYYDYLGNNNYRFYITLYRDCNSTGAQYDDPLFLAVYNKDNFLIQNISVPFPGSVILPVIFNNPCVTPPSNICVQKAIYTTTINLPPTIGGYNISYQRCCRGPNINNLISPDDTGITLTCHVPGSETNAFVNSSPRFINYPPLLLCNNEDLVFNHAATDPDGDQLIYSLVTPNAGGTSMNPQPNPTPPPNYPPVNWANNFSALNPLGPGATISINPNTGLLTASPSMLGVFVVGIRVQEVRNGVVINSTTRDFLFKVFNCVLQLQAILPPQNVTCNGLTYTFANNSFGGTNYAWDFGVNGITSDVSSSFIPTYTYPSPGNYQAMLVVNPGWPCTDTAFVDIYVNNPLNVSFTSTDSLCIFNNSFDFVGSSNGPPSTQYNWNFGPSASVQAANTLTVNDVSFSQTGKHGVTFTGQDGQCINSFTDSIYIFPEPIAEMSLPNLIQCEGLTINFGNTSQNSFIYSWDFGVQGTNTDVSSATSPTYTFQNPGNYTVTLIAGSTIDCLDTVYTDITVNLPLIVDFTSEDSLCITDNSFNFDGTVSGPPNSIYTWNFGPNASVTTSTDIDVSNVTFYNSGSNAVTLTGTFDVCQETVTHSVYLFRAPTIDFGIQPGLQCVPFNAHFIDFSSAETSIYYEWKFGDGGTSNEQNPSHLYTEVGNHIVELTIRTDAGCIDTLTLFKPDMVNVRPNPIAGFDVSPQMTDICHSLVTFTDKSNGAETYWYNFDDADSFSNESNPEYLYLTDGTHYPIQIVTNEYGCKDTANNVVHIEPFTLFAPNAFTPDGNEFNNAFKPVLSLDVIEWKFEIFNRWGEKVFETFNLDEAWDGTALNGMMAADGLYVYKITYVSCEPNSPERTLTGHVSLLK